jgi:hypothetical protein
MRMVIITLLFMISCAYLIDALRLMMTRKSR